MIAVSSFRPCSDSHEIASNQLRAKRSWEAVFDQIVYFGDAEPELASDKTQFISVDGDFPAIALLVAVAMYADEPACIINADIVVGPTLKNAITQQLWQGMKAFTSRRWQFEPGASLDSARVVDQGVDFFAATPEIWHQCYRVIPGGWRIGHSGWDSWMLGWMNQNVGRRFVDLTNRKLIFHPRHGDRKRVHHITISASGFPQCGFPVAIA